jgi:hypothetical protein
MSTPAKTNPLKQTNKQTNKQNQKGLQGLALPKPNFVSLSHLNSLGFSFLN